MGSRKMIVLDTHVWIWWLSERSFLTRTAASEIDRSDRIGICSISCFEVAFAVFKGRISIDRGIVDWLELALAQPKVELLQITPRIAARASQLGNDFHGDPADRLITATAIMESAALITKNRRIQKYSGVQTIW
jgi:PIN domain nuclease of toxin-antitoxin system